MIENFRNQLSNKTRFQLIEKLADAAAQFIKKQLENALKNNKTIFMVTHIPPWPSNDKCIIKEKFWTPYNSSKVMADMLVNTMNSHSDKKLIVLAGHTHVSRREKISNNIELRVGGSAIRKPSIQDIIVIED